MNLTGSANANERLKGKINGLKKIHGYSAYEVAVVNGFRGTEEEWLDSLEGRPGGNMTMEYDEETETLVITTHETGGGAGGSGTPGVGIASIEQTSASTANNGINVWKITLTNGTTSELQVRNGGKGDEGNDGLGIHTIRYNTNTKKLEWVDTLSNIHEINAPEIYTKTEIDDMFANYFDSYINELAGLLGGGS